MGRLAIWAGSIRHGFREFFLLSDALAAARSRTESQQQRVRELVRAADRRRAAARAQSLPDQVPSALVLLREAFLLTAQAWQSEHGPDASADLSVIAPAVTAAGARPPTAWDRVVVAMSDERPLAYDNMAADEARQVQADVEEALEWMRGLVDPRSTRELHVSRAARVGVATVAALGAVTWAGTRLIHPKDIALNHPVLASSRRAGCPPESGAAGLDPAGLVDGRKSGTFDLCTNAEPNPWVMVDLESSQPVSVVKVYNRGDCCWGTYDLPQVLEISADASTFEVIARQTAAYTESAPWVINVGGKSARYVRLRVESNEPRELVLSELEVFRGH